MPEQRNAVKDYFHSIVFAVKRDYGFCRNDDCVYRHGRAKTRPSLLMRQITGLILGSSPRTVMTSGETLPAQSTPHPLLLRIVMRELAHRGGQAFLMSVELADLDGCSRCGMHRIEPRQRN